MAATNYVDRAFEFAVTGLLILAVGFAAFWIFYQLRARPRMPPLDPRIKVGDLLHAAYTAAFERQQEVQTRWVQLSFRLGSALPNSGLPIAIQRCGRLDSLLRTLEVEAALRVADQTVAAGPLFAHEALSAFSDAWIGSTFSISFVLHK